MLLLEMRVANAHFLLATTVLFACSENRSTAGGADGSTESGLTDAASERPHLLVTSADGRAKLLALEAPWSASAELTLSAPVSSARFEADRYFVVHPAPANRVSVLDANLSLEATIELPGSDPHDVHVLGGIAYVSQRSSASLAKVELATWQKTAQIDLSVLAAPASLAPSMIAGCGQMLYVELTPPPGGSAPSIAVVDTTTDQARAIALTGPTADLDMVVDCDAQRLLVSEPVPVLLGGGGIEEVDLAAQQSLGFFVTDGAIGGESGPFVLSSSQAGWVAMHTEFGSGPSSHLVPLSKQGGGASIWDTFERVDQLAWDAPSSQLFFPDPCSDCVHPAGLVVFDAGSGNRLTDAPLALGFAPIEVVVGRTN